MSTAPARFASPCCSPSGSPAASLLIWWLARTFDKQLVEILEFLQRYQWWAVGISIAVLVLVNLRNFRGA